jgi:membrane-associated protease RseP (regulator of RpoE activity)
MNKLTAVCAFCAVALGALSNASAQPALERLEEEVRRQLGEGVQPRVPASQTPGEKADAAEKPAAPKATPEPGYLGALLDDREDRGRGVRVLRVNPGSPAQKAGLQEGDLVTALSGIRTRQLSEVADILAEFPPESEVTFFVRRGQAEKLINVTLGRRPAGTQPAPPPPKTPSPPAPPKPPEPSLPAVDPAVRAHLDALQRRIEALERDVEAWKQKTQDLERRIEAMKREPLPKPASP